VGDGSSNTKLGQVAIVVESPVAPVSYHMARQSAHQPTVPPKQLFQQVLVSRGAGGRHRRGNDAGRVIVHCHVGLVGEVQTEGRVVDDASFWVGATAGTRSDADGAQRLPMVLIHGRGFTIGAGSEPLHYGGTLTSRDVVVVTTNYGKGTTNVIAESFTPLQVPRELVAPEAHNFG
jgi:hypothetical protein